MAFNHITVPIVDKIWRGVDQNNFGKWVPFSPKILAAKHTRKNQIIQSIESCRHWVEVFSTKANDHKE